jgi:MoaA/NifB/PqqE/SkfB family radical SAM enzyme
MGVYDLSLRQHIALKLHQVYKKNETQLHKLNYLLWECTLRCNLNCRHCGSDCKQDAAVSDMPAADFLDAIDQITPIVDPNNTTIVITGGEPLLRRDLEQIGNELYQRGFPWGIVTNGLLLTEKRIRSLVDAGLRSITVSLDGQTESHNWLRGNISSFRNAMNAIQLLAKIPEINFDVVTCVHQQFC